MCKCVLPIEFREDKQWVEGSHGEYRGENEALTLKRNSDCGVLPAWVLAELW